MTPDDMTRLAVTTLDYLQAADACEEAGVWELACWCRLWAAGRTVEVGGGLEGGAVCAFADAAGGLVVNKSGWPRGAAPVWAYGWNASAGWCRYGPVTNGAPPPNGPLSEVRAALEAAAHEAVRRALDSVTAGTRPA
jgi:hypothetical protein